MQAVSVYQSKNPLVIRSEYFSVKSIDSKNSDLYVQSGSIPICMAVADISRDDRSIAKLKESFYRTLSVCKDEEDLTNLNRFLKDIASKGGYAETFYQEFSKLIIMPGIRFSKMVVEKVEENRKKTISSNKNGYIESPYLSVENIESANASFSLAASYIPKFMALTDMSRNEKSMEILENRVYNALSLCGSLDDVIKLKMLLKSLENKGGIAMSFCPSMYKYMNLQGIQHAKKQVAMYEHKKELEKSIATSQKNELEEFLEEYKKAVHLLEDVQANSALNEYEISVLKIHFDKILDRYYDLPAAVRTTEIKNLEYEIKEKIEWLRKATSVLDDQSVVHVNSI